MKETKIRNARLLFAISMAVFGTLGLFVRNIPVSSEELALYRAILAAVLIAVYMLLTKRKITFSNLKRDVILLFISGAAIGINWIFLFEAYKYTTVSAATLSCYFAPVIVTVASPILFHERLTVKKVFCFAMSTVGIVLITVTGGITGGTNDFVGILFGLGSAVLYATAILLNKVIKSVEDIQRTFLQFVAAILVLVPYVAMKGITVGAMHTAGWVNLLIVGFIHTGVNYCLYFSALKDLPGQQVAILSYIDPLVAVLISVAVLGEPMTTWQAVGGILILGFTMWNEITPKNNSNQK